MAIKCVGKSMPKDVYNKEDVSAEERKKAADARSLLKNRMLVRMMAGGKPAVEMYKAAATMWKNDKEDINSGGAVAATHDELETPHHLALYGQMETRITEAESVYDPFAGNGNLVTFADAEGTRVLVNEVLDRRVANLEKLGHKEVTQNDALDPANQPDETFQVVMVNPPVAAKLSPTGKEESRNVGRMLQNTRIDKDYSTTRSDVVGAMLALDLLDPESGRAFVMVQKGDDTALEDYIKNNFRLKRHLVLDPMTYYKSGKGIPMEIFIIDQQVPGDPNMKEVNSYDDLGFEEDFIAPDVSKARAIVDKAGAAQAIRVEEVKTRIERESERRAREAKEGIHRATGQQQEHKPEERKHRLTPEEMKNILAQKTLLEYLGSTQTMIEQENNKHSVPKPVFGQVPFKMPIEHSRLGNGRSMNPNTVMPHSLAGVKMTAQEELLNQIKSEGFDSINSYVAHYTGSQDAELPYLMEEQALDVAFIIRNHRNGGSTMLGNQTGTGKGRVLAMTAKYFLKQGITPVMFTQGSHLYLETVRDMESVMMHEVVEGRKMKGYATNSQKNVSVEEGAFSETFPNQRITVVNGSEKKSAALRERVNNGQGIGDYDFVITTYNQMKTVKGQMSERHAFIQSLAKQGGFVLDESHLAAGSIMSVQTQEDGRLPVAQFMRNLITNVDVHRVKSGNMMQNGYVFASATWLKNPAAASFYHGIGFEGIFTGNTLHDVEHVSEVLQTGGYLALEQIAVNFARNGTYRRTETTWEGVDINYQTVDTDSRSVEEQAEILSLIMQFSERVRLKYVDNWKREISESREKRRKGKRDVPGGLRAITGEDIEKIYWSDFGAALHQLHSIISSSMKANAVIQMAKDDIERGRRVVIGLEHTNDAALALLAEEANVSVDDIVEFNLTDILRLFVEKRLMHLSYDYEVDGIKQKGHFDMTEEIYSDAAMTDWLREVYEEIDRLSFLKDLPLSPIDHMRNNLDGVRVEKDTGEFQEIKTSEITGRMHMLRQSENGDLVYGHRSTTDTSAKAKRETIRAFNHGDVNVLVLNASGSTGISLQSAENFKNNEQRVFYMVQSLGNIAETLQMLGRVHRRGQKYFPVYRFLFLNTPPEQASMMLLQRKLRSMSAVTSGENMNLLSDSTTNYSADDVLGEYGDEAAWYVLETLEHKNKSDIRMMGMESALKGTHIPGQHATHPGLMAKLMKALPLLPLERQEEILDDLMRTVGELVRRAKDQGQYAGEVRKMPARVSPIEGQSYTIIPEEPQAPGKPFDSTKLGVYATDFQAQLVDSVYTAADAVEHVAAAAAGQTGQEYEAVLDEVFKEEGAKAKYLDVPEEDMDWEAITKALKRLRKKYGGGDKINLWGEYRLSDVFAVEYTFQDMLNYKSTTPKPDGKKFELGFFSEYLWGLYKDEEAAKKVDLKPAEGVTVEQMKAHPFYQYFHSEIQQTLNFMREEDARLPELVERLKEHEKDIKKDADPTWQKAHQFLGQRLKDKIENAKSDRMDKVEELTSRLMRFSIVFQEWTRLQDSMTFASKVNLWDRHDKREEPAYVIGVNSLIRGRYPYSPQDWSITFVVGSGKKRYTIPVSQFINPREGKEAYYLYSVDEEGIHPNFPHQTEQRGKTQLVTLITGNVLKAIAFIHSDTILSGSATGMGDKKFYPVAVPLEGSPQMVSGILTTGFQAHALERRATIPLTDSRNMVQYIQNMLKYFQEKPESGTLVRLQSSGGDLSIEFAGVYDERKIFIGPDTKDSFAWHEVMRDPRFKDTGYAELNAASDVENDRVGYLVRDPKQMKQALTLARIVFDHSYLHITAESRLSYEMVMGEGSLSKALFNIRKDKEAEILEQMASRKVVSRLKNILRELVPYGDLDAHPGKSIIYGSEVDVLGRYDRVKNIAGKHRAVIRVALGQPHFEPEEIVGHEAIHALRDFGLFTEREWETLKGEVDARGWMKKYRIKEFYGDESIEAQYEEAIAFAFGEYLSRRYDKYKGRFSNTAKRVFERIREFFRKLAEVILKWGGIQPSTISVFEDVMSGKVGARRKMTNQEFVAVALPDRFSNANERFIAQSDEFIVDNMRRDEMLRVVHKVAGAIIEDAGVSEARVVGELLKAGVTELSAEDNFIGHDIYEAIARAGGFEWVDIWNILHPKERKKRKKKPQRPGTLRFRLGENDMYAAQINIDQVNSRRTVNSLSSVLEQYIPLLTIRRAVVDERGNTIVWVRPSAESRLFVEDLIIVAGNNFDPYRFDMLKKEGVPWLHFDKTAKKKYIAGMVEHTLSVHFDVFGTPRPYPRDIDKLTDGDSKKAFNVRRPMSKKQFDKHAKDAEERKQEHTFLYEHIEDIWAEGSRGIEKEKLSNVDTWVKPLANMGRFLPYLEHGKGTVEWYAEFSDKIRILYEAFPNAQSVSGNDLRMMYEGLNDQEAEILNRYIVFADMQWQVANDFLLPDGITPEQAQQEFERLAAYVETNPRLRQAKARRDKTFDQFRIDLVEAGYLEKDADLNVNYYRHDVLKYSSDLTGKGRSGRKLRKVGFFQRLGSKHLYNMNVSQVDYASRVDSHVKVAMARFAKWLKESKYNIRESNARIVRKQNAKKVVRAAIDEVAVILEAVGYNEETVSDSRNYLGKADNFIEFRSRLNSMLNVVDAKKRRAVYAGLNATKIFRGHQRHNKKIREAFNMLSDHVEGYMGGFPESFPEHVVGSLEDFVRNQENHVSDLDTSFFSALAFLAHQEKEEDIKKIATMLLSRFNRRRRFLSEVIPDYVDLRNVEAVNEAAGNAGTHTVWQIGARDGQKSARHLHVMKMMPERLQRMAKEYKEGTPEHDAVMDMLDLIEHAPSVLAFGGPLEQVVIPIGMAKTLDNFFEPVLTNAFARSWYASNTTLKKHFLFFPSNNPVYFVNNRSGDAEFLFISGMLTETLMHMPKDWEIVKEFFKTGKVEDEVAQQALERGALQAGFFTHEIDVIRNFDPSTQAGMWATLGAAPVREQDKKNFLRHFNIWQGYKGTVRLFQKFSQLTESTIRLSAYRVIHDEIRKMEAAGMSREEIIRKYLLKLPTDPHVIKGIPDIDDVIGRYARDVLGDYGRTSQFTQVTKRLHIGLFHSFVETVIRRYTRLIANTTIAMKENVMNPNSTDRAMAVRDILWLWSKLLFASIFVRSIVWGDEDAEDIVEEQMRLLIPLSDWQGDGHTEMLRMEGTFNAFNQWTPYNPFAEWYENYEKGYEGVSSLAPKVGWHYMNMVLRHANPFAKLVYELMADHSVFPRFERKRPVYDGVKHVLDVVDLGAPYSEIMKAMGEPSPVRPTAMQPHRALIKEHSIGEQKWWNLISDQSKWMGIQRDVLPAVGGRRPMTRMQKYIKIYERSLLLGDEESAYLALDKLAQIERENKEKGLIAPVPFQQYLEKWMLYRAPVGLRPGNRLLYEYQRQMTPEELEDLADVHVWYKETIAEPHRRIMSTYRRQRRRRSP